MSFIIAIHQHYAWPDPFLEDGIFKGIEKKVRKEEERRETGKQLRTLSSQSSGKATFIESAAHQCPIKNSQRYRTHFHILAKEQFYIWRARVCLSLLCLCRHFVALEGCLDEI